MKINNALGFAGLLHGWDAETEQQRRRQEEDRVRQNNQDMFGITKALGNLRIGEQQRLDELGQFTQSGRLDQARETMDTFYKGAPLRAAQAEWTDNVGRAALDAKNQTYPTEVLRDMLVNKERGAQEVINNGVTANIANSDNAKYQALVNSMNDNNAENVIAQLGMSDKWQSVSTQQGVMVHPRGSPETAIPLATFKHSVLNTLGAYNASQGDLVDTRMTNQRITGLNAKGAQSSNKATLEGLKYLHTSNMDILKNMAPEDKQYDFYKRKVDSFEQLMGNGAHQ